jgi:hypothetical protein
LIKDIDPSILQDIGLILPDLDDFLHLLIEELHFSTTSAIEKGCTHVAEEVDGSFFALYVLGFVFEGVLGLEVLAE